MGMELLQGMGGVWSRSRPGGVRPREGSAIVSYSNGARAVPTIFQALHLPASVGPAGRLAMGDHMVTHSTPETGNDPVPYTPLDPGRIDLLNPAEVPYWCKQFEVTEEELREAVAAVGTHAAAVRQELRGPG
jgi:hypothetical protein